MRPVRRYRPLLTRVIPPCAPGVRAHRLRVRPPAAPVLARGGLVQLGASALLAAAALLGAVPPRPVQARPVQATPRPGIVRLARVVPPAPVAPPRPVQAQAQAQSPRLAARPGLVRLSRPFAPPPAVAPPRPIQVRASQILPRPGVSRGSRGAIAAPPAVVPPRPIRTRGSPIPGTARRGVAWWSRVISPLPPDPSPPPPPAPGPSPYRDRTLLHAIADRLRATGQWDEVLTTGPPEDKGASAASVKLACLELAAFDEFDLLDDYASITQERNVRYTLLVLVRDQDADTRDDEADRLCNVASNALNGVSIAGQTVADKTRLRRGVWQPAAAPERRIVVQGEFTYLVDDFSLHDTN
jgi:hypothetical protein